MFVSVLATIVVSAVALYIFRRRRTGVASWLPALRNRVWARLTALFTATPYGEAGFRMLGEAVPQIVWTAIPGGDVDYCNQRFYDLTGFSREEPLGWAWQKALHPDDLPLALQSWENARLTGESYDLEYRLRTAAGAYRWHLARATPTRDGTGAIVKWFGACTDIDDQMRYQEVLEEQLKQHTAALMDANSRLQMEMRDRTLAQQELNLQGEGMVRELTKRSNRMTNLARMAESLQSCAAVKDACSVVAGMGPAVFPELRGAVLLFNSSREILEVAASWADCGLVAGVIRPQDCRALVTERPSIVAAGDPTECNHAPAGLHSYFCLPLLTHGEAIGTLHFQMIESGEPPQPVLLVANMFAEQVGLSVANIRLREALRSQAIRDPLTNLYNRRYLEEMMERETRRAVRSEQGLGVLMLDHFKTFNDTHGHDAGDTVLCETASFLLKSVRAEDIVCRFGGEEFVIILPVADLNASQARAERIRSRLRELLVIHQGKSLGAITVSVGVAELPQHGTSPRELLEAADAALYRAKKAGRDRVMLADPPLAAAAQGT